MAISGGFRPRIPSRGSSQLGTRNFFAREAGIAGKGGMEEIYARYTALIRQLESVTPEALQNAMMPVFNRSQVYVPKKTGALMDSGQLNVYPKANGTTEAEIVYGSKEAWYAAMVHEYVWLNHEPPTRAKYLQNAMEEEFDSFLTSLAVDYAAVLG